MADLEKVFAELSPDERKALAARIAEAEAAEQAAADAEADPEATPAEEAAAAEREAEAEAELVAAYERAGLTLEQGQALRAVVGAETTRATAAAVREVMEEYVVEPAAEGDPPKPPARRKPATSLEDLQEDPEADPPPAPPKDEPPETPPENTHWFSRPLGRKEDAKT